MNDDQTAYQEDRAMLARLSLRSLAQLLTGLAPGMMLEPEPLAALVILIDSANGEHP